MKRVAAIFVFFLCLPFIALSGSLFVDGVHKGAIQGDVVIRGNGDIVVRTTSGGGGSTPTPEPEPEPEPSPTPADCPTVLGVSFDTFLSVNGVRGFDQPTGEKQRFTVSRGGVTSFRFTAPARDNAGYILTAADSHAPNGQHVIAMSECPGDFSQRLPQGKCRASSASHTFWWSTFGAHYRTTCELNPGQEYYLNIRYVDCGSHRCGALLAWSQYGG